jgi:hypothetical protein
MGAAPRVGNDAVSSRPYAGNSENPTVLIRLAGAVWPVMDSDNPSGADNQQERLWRCGWISIQSLENPQRPNADHLTGHIGSSCEMKLWSGPYGDVGRPAETTGPLNNEEVERYLVVTEQAKFLVG